MAEFKEGDIVYHKATHQKGVLAAKMHGGGWNIAWQDGKKSIHTEAELYTEKEYEDKFGTEPPMPIA